MKTIVQRVCWNTRGWQLPAGSTTEKGFPDENGFAHEEWNFQIEDAVDGFVYGYMRIPPSLSNQEEPFRVYFYAIHPNTKNRLLVGCYREAFLILEHEYKSVLTDFKTRKIIDRRTDELMRIVPKLSKEKARAEITNSLKESWLKIKCRTDSIQTFEPAIAINPIIGSKRLSHRFSGFTYINESELLKEVEASSHQRHVLAEDAYMRENRQNLSEIIRRHNALSNGFCEWLESKGIKPSQERQQVDVQFEYQDESYLIEIKITYGSSTRQAIREAIGQLCEYNFYPGRHPSNRWGILLDTEPSEKDIEYIRRIRERFDLTLFLCWKSETEFSLDCASQMGF